MVFDVDPRHLHIHLDDPRPRPTSTSPKYLCFIRFFEGARQRPKTIGFSMVFDVAPRHLHIQAHELLCQTVGFSMLLDVAARDWYIPADLLLVIFKVPEQSQYAFRLARPIMFIYVYIFHLAEARNSFVFHFLKPSGKAYNTFVVPLFSTPSRQAWNDFVFLLFSVAFLTIDFEGVQTFVVYLKRSF